MELRDYIEIFGKHLKLILGITALAVVSALGFRALQPTTFQTTETLTVSRINVQNTAVYKFDDYYAIQAADLFSRSIVGWLQTPPFVLDIFKDAGITAPSQDLGDLGRFITANKLSQQVLQVQFSSGNKDDAAKIAQSIVHVVKRDTAKQNALTKPTAYFNVEVSEPVISEASKSYPLVGGAALLIGLFAGYTLALLLNYLKKTAKA